MALRLTHASLAEVAEPDLIGRLLADPHWRGRFLNVQGIPSEAKPRAGVPLSALGKHGDIDILVARAEQPERATAIQVKRIKVTENTFRSGKPNRLAAVAELHAQSNLLVQVGFWQVFSYAIVVVDSRTENGGAYKYDGLTTPLQKTIEDSLSTDGLHPDAGFMKFELVQPMDDYPLGSGTFSARLVRMPTSRAQPTRVTEWVQRILGEGDA
jgi:hypothetical protein